MSDIFGVTQLPARKQGSRWTAPVEQHDSSGHTISVRATRPCKTRREARAMADIALAKLSALRAYDPTVLA